MKTKIKRLIITAILIFIGLLIFKYLPMNIYGEDILFDASSHMAWTFFGLYFVYTFIEKYNSWKIPYFIFSIIVLILMAIQRILTHHHNLIGVTLGFLVAVSSILISRKVL